ncbi:MAG: endonuclease/exonuclease/phosphatase family protein [Chitinophagales bacterium]|jgi:endonuclease/exonuclease/phosphatase family metal-dependent hydrolase
MKVLYVYLFLLFVPCYLWSQPLRVVTYNIRLDTPADGLDRWDNRKEAVVSFLLERQASIIGLQEVLPQQLLYLERYLTGYWRYGVGREDGKAKGEFGPLFIDTNRMEVLQATTQWLSITPELPGKGWDAACERMAAFVWLHDRVSGDTIVVCNTHWDHIGGTARIESAKMISSKLSALVEGGKKVLLLGDLNTPPTGEPILLLQQELVDSCPLERSEEGTFNGFDLNRSQFPRIDYVWYSPGSYRRVHYEVPHPMVRGRHVSDHFPVVVDFSN